MRFGTVSVMDEPAEDAEEVPELVPDAGPHKFQGLKKID